MLVFHNFGTKIEKSMKIIWKFLEMPYFCGVKNSIQHEKYTFYPLFWCFSCLFSKSSILGGPFTAYSNIEGGYGLFSSRTTIEKKIRFSYGTLLDLYRKQSWGFIEQ